MTDANKVVINPCVSLRVAGADTPGNGLCNAGIRTVEGRSARIVGAVPVRFAFT
jgi:hypothetical protein